MERNPLPADHEFHEVATPPIDSRSFPVSTSRSNRRDDANHKPKITSSTSPVGCPSPYALKARPGGLPEELLAQSNFTDVGWDAKASGLPEWKDDGFFLPLEEDQTPPTEMVDGASLYEFLNYGMGKKNVLGKTIGHLKGAFSSDEASKPNVSRFDHFTNALQPMPADDSSLQGIGLRLKTRNSVAVAVTASLLRVKPGAASEPALFTLEEERKQNMLFKRLKELVDSKPSDIALTDWLEPSELELWWQLTGKSQGEVAK